MNHLFRLDGKTALVTGGSKGLGLAMAAGLAGAGARVVVSARDPGELQAAVASLQSRGGAAAWISADLSQRSEVERLARECTEPFGDVDILVNNAGINIVQPIEAVRDDDWDRVLAVNLHAPMILTRALAPAMRRRRWGRIIMISSIFGLVSRAERNAYSASKSGILGLVRASSLELAPFGVTVNAILPGPFETPMTAELHPDPERRRWFTDRVPMGRWGRPEELDGPLLLLASDAGNYITGASLVVDGGWTAQ
ncbi:MAG: SDR family NAD(P)-dependent oxidoreductase [Isosphaeraceae bacterium]|nr:SDR family NAD(P)-dependent oxidoreductase [Isosphaeraceae bacterium]